MAPKRTCTVSTKTRQQSNATQTTINSTWRPTKRLNHAAQASKDMHSEVHAKQRLPTPASTPTKRKRSALDDGNDLDESQGSCKRNKADKGKDTSDARQLTTPDTTPTKHAKHALLVTPPSTPSKARSSSRQLTGRDLLANFRDVKKASTASLDDTESNEKDDARPAEPTSSSKPSVKDRGTALLARLAEKQKASKTQVAPPTLEEATRIAALHRVPDVARAISAPLGLNKANTRRSYSAAGLARVVKQSARSVIGDTEVFDVLRLLQREETALGCRGFVRIIKVGEGDAVVVDSLRRPQPDALEASARRLLDSMGAAAQQ